MNSIAKLIIINDTVARIKLGDTEVRSIDQLESITGVFYTEDSAEVFAEWLKYRNVKVKLQAGGTVLKFLKVEIVSLERWKLKLDKKVVAELEDNFSVRGRIPSGVGVAIATFLAKKTTHGKPMRVAVGEAKLASSDLDSDFFPAYRAGVVAHLGESGKLHKRVVSYDISSAYPAALVEGAYPAEESVELSKEELSGLEVAPEGFIPGLEGFIGRFTVYGAKRRPGVPLSGLEFSEDTAAFFLKDAKSDACGLVSGSFRMAASLPEMLLFALCYTWERIEIDQLFVHKLARVSEAIEQLVASIYKMKRAKNASAKILVNSLSGVIARNPIRGIRGVKSEESIRKAVDIYNGKNGTPTVVGVPRVADFRLAVYMNSWARLKLVKAAIELHKAGAELIYADTDSLKFTAKNEKAVHATFKLLNKKLQKPSKLAGLGEWVDESEKYASGAVFFGRRMYLRSHISGTIDPVLSGFDIDDSRVILQEAVGSLENSSGKELYASIARWQRVELPKELLGSCVTLQKVYQVTRIGEVK